MKAATRWLAGWYAVLGIGLGAGGGMAWAAGGAMEGLSVEVNRQDGRLEVSRGGSRLLAYVFGKGQFKPYVQELCTLQGENVLRDAPADHLHHHGLMYAIRVNGHNFWEERDHPGYERPVELVFTRTGRNAAGLPQAGFAQRIHWVAEADKDVVDSSGVALLVEVRTLTVSVDDRNQEVALRWESEFEVGARAGRVKLEGADYHGLGMRLPESFDRVARHQNGERKAYKTSDQRDVIEARWSAVTGRMGARDVTVACLGRPSEQRGPLKFFTMLEPFAYLSATQGLDLAPQEFESGESWRVAYLVLVCSTPRSHEALEERYEVWEKERR